MSVDHAVCDCLLFSEEEVAALNPEEELVDLVNNSSIASESCYGEPDTPSLIDL